MDSVASGSFLFSKTAMAAGICLGTLGVVPAALGSLSAQVVVFVFVLFLKDG